MSTILIGCKLPQGIVLDGIDGKVTINGMNTSLVAGGFGLTHVEEGEAAYLMAAYADHSAFQSQAIFTHNTASVADVADLAQDLSEIKTGFEGVDPEAPAPGLKPEGDVKQQINAAESKPRPARAPTSKADKAAASKLAAR